MRVWPRWTPHHSRTENEGMDEYAHVPEDLDVLQRNQGEENSNTNDYKAAIAEKECILEKPAVSIRSMPTSFEHVAKYDGALLAQLDSLPTIKNDLMGPCAASLKWKGKKNLISSLAVPVPQKLVGPSFPVKDHIR